MEEDRDGDKNMKSLNEDIKTGVFKQIYLLYGEEAYLKKQYKQKLTKAMISEDVYKRQCQNRGCTYSKTS